MTPKPRFAPVLEEVTKGFRKLPFDDTIVRSFLIWIRDNREAHAADGDCDIDSQLGYALTKANWHCAGCDIPSSLDLASERIQALEDMLEALLNGRHVASDEKQTRMGIVLRSLIAQQNVSNF